MLNRDMLIYESLNYPVIRLIPGNVTNLLDIGCGNGALGKHLKGQIPKLEIIGITYSEEEATLARKGMDEVIVADLNTYDFGNLKKMDVVVCSHVLEHCYIPENVLQNIKCVMNKESILVIALPNILHWKQRLLFLSGKFRYTNGGLLDSTHFRFFDWHSSQKLIQQSGFQIVHSESIGNFPLPLIRKLLPGRIQNGFDRLACKWFPGLFGFQFVFSCKLRA